MFNLRHKIFEWFTLQEWYSKFNEDLIYFRGYNFCIYLYSYDSNATFSNYGFHDLIYDAFYWPISSYGHEFYRRINSDYIKFLKKLCNDGF